jgi:outer membrane protein insertion porin family
VNALRLAAFGLLLSPAVWAVDPPQARLAEGGPPAVSTTTPPVEVLIGSVTVQGNQDVSTRAILRGLELEPGKPFSPDKTNDGQQSLYASGCFEILDVVLSTPTPYRVNVVVQVKERPARYLRGGFGYGTQTKERLTLGFEDHNFFGNLRQFDIKGTYSGFITEPHKNRTRLIETNLTQPYIFNTRLEAQANISREWDNREAYDSIATTFRGSLLRRFTKSFDARFRYRFVGTRLTRVSPEAETPDQTQISAVGPTFTYDVTDDRFLPTHGWRLIGTWEEGLTVLWSDVGFHKLEGRTGRFDTFSGWTFFEGLQIGEIFPHSGQTADIIPIFERYFMGGANTVRGYSERALGPRDALGNPLGGEAFLVGNLEVRHRLYKQVFGVLFFDGGQLYETDPGAIMPDIKLNRWDSLAYGTGAGIRVHTPVGALRLEFGYQLNPQRPTHSFWDRTALHFSIGEVF